MPCYYPLRAYKTRDGAIVFAERSRHDIVEQLSLPCGQCIGCRLARSRGWAMRCLHEASLYERNSFVTLTYDDDHFPSRGMLDYPAFQRFLKRLRKASDCPVRFYMCGEYGPVNWRPHYHACLFNRDFADRKYWSTTPSGEKLYRSAELESLWPYGFCSVGSISFESAAYVARYCVAKITGRDARYHYARHDAVGDYVLPCEFNHMSLKPGIGALWLSKFKADVFPHDYVIVRGVRTNVPKYYDVLFERDCPATFEDVKMARVAEGRSRYLDNTPERLVVKSVVATARSSLLVRTL